MGVTHVNSPSFSQIWIYSVKLDERTEIGVDALGKQRVIMLQHERRLPSACEVAAKGARGHDCSLPNARSRLTPAHLHRRQGSGIAFCLKFEGNARYELLLFFVVIKAAAI